MCFINSIFNKTICSQTYLNIDIKYIQYNIPKYLYINLTDNDFVYQFVRQEQKLLKTSSR